MAEKEEYFELTMADYLKEYLDDAQLSQNALAKALSIPSTRIHEIMRSRRKITIDTDLRLCKFFGKTDGFFLRIQEELERREIKKTLQKAIDTIVPYSIKSA